ncbi:MAG: VIT1/CCC1 transporter family protein [Cyclobacteriaceae bacterium]|nr:VIT1/CCC1 transporter family protein [Cyclobacteriaceae bacterium]
MNDQRAQEFHRHHTSQNHGDFLREFVYGGFDGGVTTFAVVAGATGAHFDSAVIIILGLANLLADGFSMSVGSYLSVKSDRERYLKYQRFENWGVENIPEMERDEIKEIYYNKGLRGKVLEKVVKVITADKELWVEEMMKGEFDLIPEKKSPLAAGWYTFLSFLLIGFIPLVPFIFAFSGWAFLSSTFAITCLVTALAFIVIGLIKAHINHTSKRWAVIETLALGAAAATLAYFTGSLLENIVLNS